MRKDSIKFNRMIFCSYVVGTTVKVYDGNKWHVLNNACVIGDTLLNKFYADMRGYPIKIKDIEDMKIIEHKGGKING